MPPMGYAVETDTPRGGSRGTVPVTRFVRTTQPDGVTMGATGSSGPAGQAARAAARPSTEDIPYFTLPENATLAGVTAMTSIIGRVPIDGRVTDPMQFKAVIGRDNLAANGFELPADISGMIVTGVAVGDMALSCSEGKIRSVTFVFNDGAIRTVSSRNRSSSSGIGGGGSITGSGSSSSFGSSNSNNDHPRWWTSTVAAPPAWMPLQIRKRLSSACAASHRHAPSLLAMAIPAATGRPLNPSNNALRACPTRIW